jgi:Protein of unknown function (DUF1064)
VLPFQEVQGTERDHRDGSIRQTRKGFLMRVPIRLNSPSKYRAQRQGKYASKKEEGYAAKLALWQRIGEISNLQEQVRFELLPKDEMGPAVVYVADFVFDDKFGHHVVDTKGFRTKDYKLKRRFMFAIHKIKIEEV